MDRADFSLARPGTFKLRVAGYTAPLFEAWLIGYPTDCTTAPFPAIRFSGYPRLGAPLCHDERNRGPRLTANLRLRRKRAFNPHLCDASGPKRAPSS